MLAEGYDFRLRTDFDHPSCLNRFQIGLGTDSSLDLIERVEDYTMEMTVNEPRWRLEGTLW